MVAVGKHYEGIGGWLILPMIGLFLTPVNSVFVFLKQLPLFSEGAWEELTTPASRLYNHLWGPAILLEGISNAAFLIAAVVLLVLLFRKSFWFPFLMILFILVQLAVVVILQFLLHSIPAVDKRVLLQGYLTIGWAGLSAIIWVPYFMLSKRIKNTYYRN